VTETRPNDPDFMLSLARGLSVIRCFADERRPMTIAQASRLSGLSRPAVRRCLHTLVELGYAVRTESRYELRPSTLALGYAYLSSNTLAQYVQPLLDRLRDQIGESCSLGLLDEDEVCYVARAEISRIMSISLRVGSRLPLYATSMGRVLLAGQSLGEREAYLDRTQIVAQTSRTQTDRIALLKIFAKVEEQGYAVVDQELEPGLRSVAVPVRDRKRHVIAALNIGTQAARVTAADLRSRLLPALQSVARDIQIGYSTS
jgi:IclR family pca regulon transcriptional regulator